MPLSDVTDRVHGAGTSTGHRGGAGSGRAQQAHAGEHVSSPHAHTWSPIPRPHADQAPTGPQFPQEGPNESGINMGAEDLGVSLSDVNMDAEDSGQQLQDGVRLKVLCASE